MYFGSFVNERANRPHIVIRRNTIFVEMFFFFSFIRLLQAYCYCCWCWWWWWCCRKTPIVLFYVFAMRTIWAFRACADLFNENTREIKLSHINEDIFWIRCTKIDADMRKTHLFLWKWFGMSTYESNCVDRCLVLIHAMKKWMNMNECEWERRLLQI